MKHDKSKEGRMEGVEVSEEHEQTFISHVVGLLMT